MAATTLAAESAFEKVFGSEDHIGAIPVEISAFDELGRGGHFD
jgi:hypothetical protein